VCVIVKKAPKSLSLSRFTIYYVCTRVLLCYTYICTYTVYIVAWKSENRTLERIESSVSGGAVRRRIADMFALFDFSKAAEALSVHGHAACTCSGRSRDLATLFLQSSSQYNMAATGYCAE